MEEKARPVASCRSAPTVDGPAKERPIRPSLSGPDALVTEAEARVSAAEAEGEQAAGGEARLALMAAGTQRGLRVGPAQNAEQALARALGRRVPLRHG